VRYWYTPERRAPCYRASCLGTYRGITGVTLDDGHGTSFRLDIWSTAGVLAAALPALFSQCIDCAVTVARNTAALLLIRMVFDAEITHVLPFLLGRTG
jgi:hypothetical protein